MSQNLALNLFIIENIVVAYFAYKYRAELKHEAQIRWAQLRNKFK